MTPSEVYKQGLGTATLHEWRDQLLLKYADINPEQLKLVL